MLLLSSNVRWPAVCFLVLAAIGCAEAIALPTSIGLPFRQHKGPHRHPHIGSTPSSNSEEIKRPNGDIVHRSHMAPYPMNTQQIVYVWLCSIFVTCLITADVIGVKLFEIKIPFKIFGHSAVEHTCGMLTFPVTFLLGDVINEYYGPAAAKRTVYMGLLMSILVFIIVNLAEALPFLDKPFNVTPEAFNSIFGSAKIMYVASLTAYLFGQLADIWMFGLIKRLTRGKMLWLRATGSTVISQMLDSFVVSYIAFGIGKTLTGHPGASMAEVWNIAITGYMLKFAAAALITPLLYATRSLMHTVFGLEPLPADYEE